jgi:hypothetical protein
LKFLVVGLWIAIGVSLSGWFHRLFSASPRETRVSLAGLPSQGFLNVLEFLYT